MIHKMAQQHANMTHVFSETFTCKRQFAAILMKKKLIRGVNRWEKDALVIDSAGYDMVRSL